MNFDLIVSENCSTCKRTEKELQKFVLSNEFIILNKIFQRNSTYKTAIVPSLFIDGKLFCYGDIDFSLLKKKIEKVR
ncbi:MAG: hypothetical protein COW71_02175 [Ignavibacteriales bacterium CG18_big_fil_WC_8_21_14_2_50_31_20]|nr:MAG: hypothetical protein COW71_02175 [Ignavibacteriales bacterium CG18_big_fil_WC_8_21_14_2_50_31_20]